MCLLLRGLMSAGWVVPEVKLPVTICGNSIISPEDPTCITLYMTASNKRNRKILQFVKIININVKIIHYY